MRGCREGVKRAGARTRKTYLLECFLGPRTYSAPLPGEVQRLSGAASVSRIKVVHLNP